MYRILVVDDEAELRKQIVAMLNGRGYATEEAADGLEAAQKLAQEEFPLVLCDMKMPNMDGLELVKHVREQGISTCIVLITAHGTIRHAVEAIQEGAFEYIEKPIDESYLMRVVEKAENAFHMLQRIALSAPMQPGDGTECVGTSPGMPRVFQLVERLTRVNTSV